ncbi:hypothetical protein [Salinicola sp. DM10]|nr:hypothetical protein [Salinicola sp. DM10]MCE3025763.1 hypothetical protein [Salinicola sp. DM10]
MTNTAKVARQRLGLSERAPESRLARFRRRLTQKRAGNEPRIELWRVS